MSGLWTQAIPNLITVYSRSRGGPWTTHHPEISSGLAAFGLIRPNTCLGVQCNTAPSRYPSLVYLQHRQFVNDEDIYSAPCASNVLPETGQELYASHRGRNEVLQRQLSSFNKSTWSSPNFIASASTIDAGIFDGVLVYLILHEDSAQPFM